jgi:uncharacterized protein
MQYTMQARPVNGGRRNAAVVSTLALCLALCVSVSGCATSQGAAMSGSSATAAKEKVIFQVSESDPKNWNLALNNMKNVQDALGKDKVEVELVVYGPGIGMLKDESTAGNRVNDAIKNGVKVVACENTMHALKLTKADMLPSIGYVPGGVIELMQKQKEGYAYIKP